jgi:hypothetical protein
MTTNVWLRQVFIDNLLELCTKHDQFTVFVLQGMDGLQTPVGSEEIRRR